jgi:hypothetical protein
MLHQSMMGHPTDVWIHDLALRFSSSWGCYAQRGWFFVYGLRGSTAMRHRWMMVIFLPIFCLYSCNCEMWWCFTLWIYTAFVIYLLLGTVLVREWQRPVAKDVKNWCSGWSKKNRVFFVFCIFSFLFSTLFHDFYCKRRLFSIFLFSPLCVDFRSTRSSFAVVNFVIFGFRRVFRLFRISYPMSHSEAAELV